jgi:hypothetical protein
MKLRVCVLVESTDLTIGEIPSIEAASLAGKPERQSERDCSIKLGLSAHRPFESLILEVEVDRCLRPREDRRYLQDVKARMGEAVVKACWGPEVCAEGG